MLSIAFLLVMFLCAYIPVILLIFSNCLWLYFLELGYFVVIIVYSLSQILGNWFPTTKVYVSRFGEKLVISGNVCMFTCLLGG